MINELYKKILLAEKKIKQIDPGVVTTPLEKSEFFSELTGAEVYLKNEGLQRAGAFKLRGALNKLLALTPDEKSHGVVAASSGNHGASVAMAGKLLGIKVLVYTPVTASPVKLQAIERLGATIETVPGDALQAEVLARQVAEETNRPYISPYNDEEVIVGQGTVGLEIIQQCPDVSAVFTAVGGGGLISGIGSYLKAVKPTVELIGCWPANDSAMYQSLVAGKIVEIEGQPTLSDATAGGVEANAVTFSICQQVIDHSELVEENEIATAIKELLANERLVTEGAGGVALSAAIKRINNTGSNLKGKKVVVVLSGRNIAFDKLLQILQHDNYQ